MRANYETKVKPGTLGLLPYMTEREGKAWILTEKYRMQEYEAVVDAIEISLLYGLAHMEKDPFGPVRLKRAWESMIRARVKARTMLRQCDGEYKLAATGKNVEDFYMREELRKMGVTPWEWQKHMTINDETGEVVFHDA